MKRNRGSVLIERNDIIKWRAKYLRTIKKYRIEGRNIYYFDETWINEGHIKEKVILHVGSESGFVDKGLVIFEGKNLQTIMKK